jgi:CheY-like chemotaxis protein
MDMPNLKVLLTEDAPDNRELAELVLRRNGFEVVSAGTGEELMRHLCGGEFDVLVLDIQLPDVDGLRIVGELRANEKTARMPIIGVTALAMKGDRERVLEAGCNAYIEKPYSTRTLAKRIEQVVAEARASEAPSG